MKPKIPKKHQPRGYEILFEDRDLLIGNKAPGILTVAAQWEKTNTVHGALIKYVRKGDVRSRKTVYVVHRLDQATSGILVFAKSESAQAFIKDNWKTTLKTYFAIVHGTLREKHGIIESYLLEDEEYVVHSSAKDTAGKLARTEYTVVHEMRNLSLLKINLLTGRKNQIRVHMAEAGHPVFGDAKYGRVSNRAKDLALHSAQIILTHPFTQARIQQAAPVPKYFLQIFPFDYEPCL